jgi:hypothetical protein
LKRKIWVLVLVIGLCVLFAGIIIFTGSIGGMTLGLMGNAEQASIMKVRFVEGAPTGDTMKLTVRNSGATNVSIISGYANGIKATNINSGQAFVIPKATSLEVTLTFPNGTLVFGNQHQVKISTIKGNNIVYSLVYDSTCTSQYDPLKDDATPLPIPIQKSASNPWQEWSPPQKTAVIVFSIVAVFAVFGACKLAQHVVSPKSKKDLFVLFFFVTLIVVFAIIAFVNSVFFPPEIHL